MLQKTSFDIEPVMRRQANIAAAAMGLSAAEFYRACIRAGLDTMAEHDPRMKVAFEMSAELPGRLEVTA
jgi:hypothetical protein